MEDKVNEQELIEAINLAYQGYCQAVEQAYQRFDASEDRVAFFHPALNTYRKLEQTVIDQQLDLIFDQGTFIKRSQLFPSA